MSGSAKRALILSAAEKLLRERRVHELTMDEVAEVAGVGKGTIYNHFASKDELIFQLATNGFDELCLLVASTPKGQPFDRRLLALCEHISGFFEERHPIIRMIHEHESRFGSMEVQRKERWLHHRRQLADVVASVMAQGVAEGVVRGDVRLDVLATMMLGMLGARGRDYAHAPDDRPPLGTVVDIFLRGACRDATEAETAMSPDQSRNTPCASS